MFSRIIDTFKKLMKITVSLKAKKMHIYTNFDNFQRSTDVPEAQTWAS